MYRGYTYTQGGLNARAGFYARKRPTKKQEVYKEPETKPENEIKTEEVNDTTKHKKDHEMEY